jgi:hypothetical protein
MLNVTILNIWLDSVGMQMCTKSERNNYYNDDDDDREDWNQELACWQRVENVLLVIP